MAYPGMKCHALFTDIDLRRVGAHLADHLAAPFELAVALGRLLDRVRVVAPSAAQRVAAVRSIRSSPESRF